MFEYEIMVETHYRMRAFKAISEQPGVLIMGGQEHIVISTNAITAGDIEARLRGIAKLKRRV